MSEPIVITVKRYKCPHCNRSRSAKKATADHMTRCWQNPAARGCLTCANYSPPEDACGCEPGCNWGNGGASIREHCTAGVSLAGQPACINCGGANFVDTGATFHPRFAAAGRVLAQCTTCGGDGAAVRPGPIVHCDLWEPVDALS